MKLKVFSILDVKAESFLELICFTTIGEAERFVKNLVSKANTNFSKYPEDFVLYQIGEYNAVKGLLMPFDKPSHVGKLLDFVPKVSKEN